MPALGCLVGRVDAGRFLPQATRTLRLRHDRAAIHGLGIWTWTIAALQGAAWIVCGFAEKLLPIAIPNLIIAPTCASILTTRLRRSSQRPGDRQTRARRRRRPRVRGPCT